MKFLPKDYKRPDKRKQFMKLEVGKNKIRILSPALIGWVLFNNENQPMRRGFDDAWSAEEIKELNLKPKDGQPRAMRHFWAFLVWDYETGTPKVLEVTQVSIQKGLQALLEDEDYGPDPSKYDIEITRTGSGQNDTEYSMIPKPPKPVSKQIEKVLELIEDGFSLPKLLEGEYPFSDYSTFEK